MSDNRFILVFHALTTLAITFQMAISLVMDHPHT